MASPSVNTLILQVNLQSPFACQQPLHQSALLCLVLFGELQGIRVRSTDAYSSPEPVSLNVSYRPNSVKRRIYTATLVSVSPAASAFMYASVISRVRYVPKAASSSRRTMGKVSRMYWAVSRDRQ